MPSVLDTAERSEDIDGHDLPSAHPRFWRPWAPRTPRSPAMPYPQMRETLMELVARQHPFLYSQADSGL